MGLFGIKNKRNHWICKCDCGKQKTVSGSKLKNGNTKSCGCILTWNHSIHRMSRTPTHNTWCSMKQRCMNKNYHNYNSYGGRGITVCGRWLNYENFYKDMGERPYGKTLDRIDNNGNYEPSNCRWSTRSEQNSNQRKRMTWKGKPTKHFITSGGHLSFKKYD